MVSSRFHVKTTLPVSLCAKVSISPTDSRYCIDRCCLPVTLHVIFRYHRNLSDKTLILVGTIPLATYHRAPTAPSADEMEGDRAATKPPGEAGFVVPSANATPPQLPMPESHLYPNLRKDNLRNGSVGYFLDIAF